MIKANELRIGSFIENDFQILREDSKVDYLQVTSLSKANGLYWKIARQDGGEISGYKSYADAKPITLTQEWLLRFGFVYDGGSGWKSPHNTEHWYWTLRNGFMCNAIARGSIKTDGYIGVHCVHQLQNLYFALTGEELILKK